MIQNEIGESILASEREVASKAADLDQKKTVVGSLRTPRGVCYEYQELLGRLPQLVNKKRRDTQREIDNLLDEHRYLKQDIELLEGYNNTEREYKKLVESIEYRKQYLQGQTEGISKILVEKGFIREVESEEDKCPDYSLTFLGRIAAHIAEIHPLPLSEIMADCSDLTTVQWVGLFSCFTDCKVAEEQKVHSYDRIENNIVRGKVRILTELYRYYDDQEAALDIRTGIHYDEALQYNLVDLAMKWCSLSDEAECKQFIQGDVYEMGISIGEFTKAMMKIVTIANEWTNACEQAGWIELKHTLTGIESMILKYVLTTQSLYV
jgi:hypothetical protein